MEEKIDAKQVQQYSASYAEAVADRFFSASTHITGSAIMELCDTPQINFFVIRELLVSWEKEAQKYKSPYFDYDSTEVQEALTRFRNALSNHISIARDHFVPLLQKGVTLTLYLVLSPYDFYSYTLNRREHIRLDYLQNEVKYIKINKDPLTALVQKLIHQGITSLSGKEAFMRLEQLLEELNFTPEDVAPHIAQLNRISPLEITGLYGSSNAYAPAGIPLKDAVETIALEGVGSKARPVVTLAENYRKIDYLKESLTLNQKFMFTKMLFYGDFNNFNKVVSKIDSMSSLDEALSYLNTHYANWNRKSEEYEEFIELLEHRFN